MKKDFVVALEEHYWDTEVQTHFKERGPEMRNPDMLKRLNDLASSRRSIVGAFRECSFDDRDQRRREIGTSPPQRRWRVANVGSDQRTRSRSVGKRVRP